jgi:hypothetical protein
MSLPFLPSEQELLPKTAEELKEWDAQYVAYLENTNQHPQNFPEGSEERYQFEYTGRKKRDKQTLMNSLTIEDQSSLFT